jgi:hypothetical protein
MEVPSDGVLITELQLTNREAEEELLRLQEEYEEEEREESPPPRPPPPPAEVDYDTDLENCERESSVRDDHELFASACNTIRKLGVSCGLTAR